MRLNRKWRLSIISPLVAVLGFYLFLIGANYYYAKRAAYLLERIRALKIDNSCVEEIRRLGSERGFRYDGYADAQTDNCVNMACLDVVSPNNQWMWFFLRSPTLARLAAGVGLRPWFVVGDIEIKNGQVVSKIYGLKFYEDHVYPEIEAAAWQEQKLELDLCTYYPVKRHPGYGFSRASNIRSFRVLVSDSAPSDNREHAFQFNLSCLTGWHKCNQFFQLMPAAWADYEEDGRWSETHPNNLVWQVGTKCPY
jgi:hypothetical protein